jgi:multidrug resistance efflux pump
MGKYIAGLCIAIVMGAAMLIIDARSAAIDSSERSRHDHPESEVAIYATGFVEGATKDIHLRAEHFGRVRQVLVRAGQWVDAGEVLVYLDDDKQRQEVMLATARLELADAELERIKNGAHPEEREDAHSQVRATQAQLEQALRNLERFQRLRHDRAITQQEADDQQSLVDVSRAQWEAAQARARHIEAPPRDDELRAAAARVAAAQAELELAEIGLSKTEIKAPYPAYVLDVSVEAGELTGPDSAQPIIVLSDISAPRVRAYVEELDAPRVSVGMSAAVTADGLGATSIAGRVVSVSPRMETKSIHSDRPYELYDTKVREVMIELDRETKIVVGLRVDVSFSIVNDVNIDPMESSVSGELETKGLRR